MEFLQDGSIRRILILSGLILVLFGVYLLMVYLSNQSTKRLGQRVRSRGRCAAPQPGTTTRSRWALPVLILIVAGLCGFLIFSLNVEQ